MTASAPFRPSFPLALRLLNAGGAALQAGGLRLPSLREETLLARASRRTGLSDFGDDSFRDPLRRLLAAMEEEAELHTLGRLIARADVVRLLENRLRLVDEAKRHPEIGAGEVRAPIFVLGLPRTGTAILHDLLAQDPSNRVPLSWEVMHPWPPPKTATYHSDPRIAQVDEHFSGVDRLIPGFQAMHPMGALLPQECVALTAHDFASMLFSTTHRVPSYQAWLESTDLRWVYASHRRQLQYLQWRCPAERWVLKSPGHLWALDALVAVYPDARVVQTHRDPVKVTASLSSLAMLLRSMASRRVDAREIGAEWAPRLAEGLRRTSAVRESGALPAERVFDLRFRDFLGREIESVRDLYSHFGLHLSDEAERRMRAFLAANPRDKHGVHRYRLEQFGLDAATLRESFGDYYRRFGIEPEV